MNSVSEFEKRRAELIAEINEAFDGVAREDGITLHEGVAIDDYKSSEERPHDVSIKKGAGRRCRDKDVIECGSPLSFLDQKGFRYYIPVFILSL